MKQKSIDAFLPKEKAFKTELIGAKISTDLLKKIEIKCTRLGVTKSQVIQASMMAWTQGEK